MKLMWEGDWGIVAYSIFKAVSENIFYVFFFVYMTKYIYTSIENKTPFNEFVLLVAIMCGIHVLTHISSALHAYYMKVRSPEVYRHIFGSVIDKAREMDYTEFERPDFFDRFTRAINDSVTRGFEILDNISWFLANVIAALIASWIIIEVDPFLLVFVIPSVAASLYFGSKTGKLYYELDFSNTRDGRTASYVKRVFYEKKYAGEIRLFNIKDVLLKRHKEAYDSIYERTKKIRRKTAAYEAARWSIFVVMSLSLPLLYTAFVVKNVSGVDVAAYISMAISLDFISWNISASVDKIILLNKSGLFVNNLHEFLDYSPSATQKSGGIAAQSLDDIEIKNMSFTYEGASVPTLKNVDLTIKKGERVAFVGHNGAGKTTLVKLLMGLYKPTEGEISVSGKTTTEYELDSYHSRFGTVFQDLQVFALPLSHNVIMREPKDENERALVKLALEKAQFGEKLEKLPRGIDTIVSKEFDDDGVVLSGGETQKIAIARVFAKDPDIVILDEPSSALDPIAEYKMYRNMMEISGDKTVIFISHRLSSARLADMVYMFENGTVIESGTHDSLMEQNGKYAEMFRLQAKNYQESLPEDFEYSQTEVSANV